MALNGLLSPETDADDACPLLPAPEMEVEDEEEGE